MYISIFRGKEKVWNVFLVLFVSFLFVLLVVGLFVRKKMVVDSTYYDVLGVATDASQDVCVFSFLLFSFFFLFLSFRLLSFLFFLFFFFLFFSFLFFSFSFSFSFFFLFFFFFFSKFVEDTSKWPESGIQIKMGLLLLLLFVVVIIICCYHY